MTDKLIPISIKNYGTATVLNFAITQNEKLCIIDTSNLALLQYEMRFKRNAPYIRNYQVGCVVISIEYMNSNNIPYHSLADVITWMKNNYNRIIGETHHRISKRDNRACALQKAEKEEHKTYQHWRGLDKGRKGLTLEDQWRVYIAETEKHCCNCYTTTYIGKHTRDESIPFSCKRCKSCSLVDKSIVKTWQDCCIEYIPDKH